MKKYEMIEKLEEYKAELESANRCGQMFLSETIHSEHIRELASYRIDNEVCEVFGDTRGVDLIIDPALFMDNGDPDYLELEDEEEQLKYRDEAWENNDKLLNKLVINIEKFIEISMCKQLYAVVQSDERLSSFYEVVAVFLIEKQAENYIKKYRNPELFTNGISAYCRLVSVYPAEPLPEVDKIILPAEEDFIQLSVEEQVNCYNALANAFGCFDQIGLEDDKIIDLSSGCEEEGELFKHLLELWDAINEINEMLKDMRENG